MPGALAGVRVVDFGQYVPGPLAAVMLADQGADVLHVDPPGGPRWRSPADAFYNRGKRRTQLNLKDAADRAAAQALIAEADVVVENFRPGAMERLGLGPQAMTERNPRLIYCSLPGFASDDPRASVAGWEGVVAAATDIYHSAGELYSPRDPLPDGLDPSQPSYTAIPLASNFAGFHGATAIVMALIERHRSGLGQRIEVPLFDAVFELFGVQGISVDGVYPPQNSSPYGGGKYQCGDGRWVQFSTSTPAFWTRFAASAGLQDWGPAGLLDPHRLEQEPALRQELRTRLRALFQTRPAAEWELLANAGGTPMTMVRSAPEWIATEHARTWGTVVQLDDPELGPTWMPGVHIHLTDSPAEARPRVSPSAAAGEALSNSPSPAAGEALSNSPSPAAGEARPVSPSPTEARGGGPALSDAGGVRVPAASAAVSASCLNGLRVLDLTQVVAGPCAGRILVEYGADVIKINSATAGVVPAEFSTSGRPADPGNQQHEHLNRGKRSILLDVASPQGREVFWQLVEKADVVMQNFPLGTAERYGIDYEAARAHKPDIIYFSLSAYGYEGPMGAWRGYEGNAQAATGLMDRFGGDGPPMSQPFLLDDYGTGVRGAFGIALAVYHRLQTGRGQHVMTALVETASYHEAAYLLDYAGKAWDEPRGPAALGQGPLQRLYKAKDAWFFLGAADEDLPRLAEIAGLDGIAGLRGRELELGLEHRFAREPLAVWLDRLRGYSIGAHGLDRMRDLMESPWSKAHGLSITQQIEEVGAVQMPGVAPRMSRTPPRPGFPVRPPGADLPQVLEEHGLADRLPDLVRASAVRFP